MSKMAIRCPHCGLGGSIDEQYNKQTVTCPKCHRQYTATRALSEWKHYEGKTVAGKYLLHALLGAGSFAGVFRAGTIANGQPEQAVAVKVIPPDPHVPHEQQTRELIASMRLEHPTILRGLDAGQCEVDGAPFLYLVMKLAEGTLDLRIRRGPLSLKEVREVAEDIVSALVYLHEEPRRLVHRDVKPANILRIDNSWKLSDFGGTYPMERRVKDASQKYGTERYMPPEGFEGVVTPALDMWSFGLMLAEALTGTHPYRSDRDPLFAVTQTEPNLPVDLPYPFDEIIHGCLIPKRSTRWTALQVHAALESSRGMRAYLAGCRWNLQSAMRRSQSAKNAGAS